MFIKMYEESGSGGSDVSGSQDLTLPTESINVAPAGGSVEPDRTEATPDEIAEFEKDQGIEEKPSPDKPEPGAEEKPETTTDDLDFTEFEMDPEVEKAYLADLGPDFAEYGSVREALLGLHEKHSALEPEYQKINQVMQRLDQVAKALNVSPDDVIASLGSIDPRNVADQGPQWENTDKYLGGVNFDDPNAATFHKGMAGAILQDVLPAVQGQFGRILNGLYSDIADVRTDMSLNKFMGNSKNAEWVGREADIKHALEMNPGYRDKPNAIDLATRWIKAGAEPKSVKKQVSDNVRKALQEIQAKKRAGHLESPGRGIPSGKAPTDLDKMSHDQVGALIDDAERKGAVI